MIDMTHSLLLVLVIAAGTLLLRFLPFLLFPANRETPSYITYLGEVLPFAIMGMLVVYCLKGVSVSAPPYGAAELLSILLVVLLYLWKRSTLLSIAAGTICYMFLIQVVF